LEIGNIFKNKAEKKGVSVMDLKILLLLFILFIIQCGSLMGPYRLLAIIKKILLYPFGGKNLASI
jgi:hypothetical protein